ncbi:MAG: helix-turn-helix transcriptional regulator [Desulfosporosinus sp.]|nr:helix-turn-helix transcriptional regulator [Desulfosporosinus sp.]
MSQIKKIIVERNLKIDQIASEAGLPLSSLYAIVNDGREPSVSKAIKIARALNATVEELFV